MHQNSQHVDNNRDNKRVNNGSIHRGGILVCGGGLGDMLLGNRICNIIECLPWSTHWLPLNLKFVDSPHTTYNETGSSQANAPFVSQCMLQREGAALVLRAGFQNGTSN